MYNRKNVFWGLKTKTLSLALLLFLLGKPLTAEKRNIPEIIRFKQPKETQTITKKKDNLAEIVYNSKDYVVCDGESMLNSFNIPKNSDILKIVVYKREKGNIDIDPLSDPYDFALSFSNALSGKYGVAVFYKNDNKKKWAFESINKKYIKTLDQRVEVMNETNWRRFLEEDGIDSTIDYGPRFEEDGTIYSFRIIPKGFYIDGKEFEIRKKPKPKLNVSVGEKSRFRVELHNNTEEKPIFFFFRAPKWMKMIDYRKGVVEIMKPSKDDISIGQAIIGCAIERHMTAIKYEFLVHPKD